MADAAPSLDLKALSAAAEAGDPSAQLRLSRLYRHTGDAGQARRWLDRAVEQGFAPAFGERGLERLARLEVDDAIDDLNRAANAKDGAAMMALAGLAATGVAPNFGGWPAATGLTIAAARAGDKAAWRELGLLLAQAGEAAMSLPLLAHAAALGDGIAVHAVLARAHRGEAELDAARATAYRWALQRIGFPLRPPGEAGALAATFPPPGPEPKIEWDAVAARLRQPPGQRFAMPAQVSASPDIWRVAGFFTAEECDYAIASAAASLQPARVLDPGTGQGRRDPLRTNLAAAESAAWMSPAKAALALRLAAFAGTGLAKAEPAGLLCYRPGEEYRPHFDWLGPGAAFDAGGQRLRTVLVYLNEGYRGGQTRFLTPGYDVEARKGDAVHFVNANPSGEPDMTTRHAGMPVLTGEKYIWSQWYRARDVMPSTQKGLTHDWRI